MKRLRRTRFSQLCLYITTIDRKNKVGNNNKVDSRVENCATLRGVFLFFSFSFFLSFFFFFFFFFYYRAGPDRESRIVDTRKSESDRGKKSLGLWSEPFRASTATNPSWTDLEISANQPARPESRADL